MVIAIQTLLYADDIALIYDSPEGQQRHLNALKLFCTDKGLSIDMNKTLVMVFNTIQACVTRSEPEFFLGLEKVAYRHTHLYIPGVTFIGPMFSLGEVVSAWLSHGYAAHGASWKTVCTFAVPRATNKVMAIWYTCRTTFIGPIFSLWEVVSAWLVAPTLLYGVQMWGQSLNK